jgi:hypothetical protein
MSLVNVDESLFLDSLEDFKRCLLPGINADRVATGLPALSQEQEIIDEYLDRYRAARSEK